MQPTAQTLPSFGMPQGRSGVQALFVCGLGQTIAPGSRDSEKNKTFCVAVAQSNGVQIFYWSFALRHSHV
jgi:hypothetical protein